MRHLALAAALALTMSPLTAGAALAQTAPAAASRGLTPAEVGTWITGLGGRVGPVQTENGLTFFTVTNAGLTWAVFFYGCEAGVCGEVQFSAVVPGAGATLDKVNAWNHDNRYLKAFHTPAATPTRRRNTMSSCCRGKAWRNWRTRWRSGCNCCPSSQARWGMLRRNDSPLPEGEGLSTRRR